ncbi:MAG: amidohydrolase family protein [Achromobacter sp.]|uniref:Adenine deaminase n=1 Tax=Achromobacter piechaudii TaxID=72556 RepID=A0ABM8KU68_9BURK|nr:MULTISPECIES: amidohydrolase family protein [Achromobacter]KNY11772.1 peptidase M38 [Achromobacter piechaudii]MPS79946.1 amidohydrolase family protein [Achromobacter sp.]CAB3674777.1 Adenine deaminase [Achromobacter piechaudii]CAB3839540.1 Adenine deaminase [Achromobacter piechaudii]CAB3942546.1 Adenine deaminase [Achromobacter piechaudii]
MKPVVVKNCKILNTRTLVLEEAANVLIEEGMIARISADELTAPDAEVVDAKGMTLMPGMIDCHVHVVASSFNLGRVAALPNALALLRALPIMQGMLDRGFTSVRDAGGADWALAQAVLDGVIDGPRLFCSGKALSQTGGHGDFRPRNDELDPCPCSVKIGNIGRVVDGVDNCRLAVREEILKGATQIKVMASGGVASPNDPIQNLGFSEAELIAIVEEASNANTYVMAHAYTPRAISRAVRCGVRTIEHGNLVDREAAEVMKAHGAYMVPTLITYEGLANDGERYGLPLDSVKKIATVRTQGLKALEILDEVGVKMGYGSDLLGETHYMQADELVLRGRVLGNAKVIQQATLIGAEILNQQGLLGEVCEGAHADLLLIDGNPLDDISLLTQPDSIKLIMNRGLLHKNAC